MLLNVEISMGKCPKTWWEKLKIENDTMPLGRYQSNLKWIESDMWEYTMISTWQLEGTRANLGKLYQALEKKKTARPFLKLIVREMGHFCPKWKKCEGSGAKWKKWGTLLSQVKQSERRAKGGKCIHEDKVQLTYTEYKEQQLCIQATKINAGFL